MLGLFLFQAPAVKSGTFIEFECFSLTCQLMALLNSMLPHHAVFAGSLRGFYQPPALFYGPGRRNLNATCLPCSMAYTAISACIYQGVVTMTRSISFHSRRFFHSFSEPEYNSGLWPVFSSCFLASSAFSGLKSHKALISTHLCSSMSSYVQVHVDSAQ